MAVDDDMFEAPRQNKFAGYVQSISATGEDDPEGNFN
jgi:hypothetical protein